MSGYNAYANYCTACNDVSPTDTPRFTSGNHHTKHAQDTCGEQHVHYTKEAFLKSIQERVVDELQQQLVFVC